MIHLSQQIVLDLTSMVPVLIGPSILSEIQTRGRSAEEGLHICALILSMGPGQRTYDPVKGKAEDIYAE